jgi:superfamily II DNA/RNA helicase
VLSQIVARPARTLVFVRTKHGADRLARQLSREGTEAGAIHGNLAQNARQRALDAFAGRSDRVLVATDVAARGIHVDDVDLVVHFDPPADHKDYLHRSGRTARAGATGTVLSMLLPDQAREAGRLLQRAGLDVPITAVQPGHDAVLALGRSGEPIVVRAEPAAPQRPASGAGRNRAGSQPGSPSGPSPRPPHRPQHQRSRRLSHPARRPSALAVGRPRRRRAGAPHPEPALAWLGLSRRRGWRLCSHDVAAS